VSAVAIRKRLRINGMQVRRIVTRDDLVIGTSVACVVLVNLAADCGLFWLTLASSIRVYVNEGVTGLIFDQLMRIGLWVGLGDRSWYVRAATSAAMTMGITRSITRLAGSQSKTNYTLNPQMVSHRVDLSLSG